MFSVTTTASSITSPMAIAIPPRLIRLKVRPMSFIPNTVMAMVSGMLAALMAVMRPWRRKSEEDEHRQERADEHGVAHRADRLAHQRRLVVDALDAHARRACVGLQRAPWSAATLSATASVLPPAWREMLTSAAGRPSPRIRRTRSSVPMLHRRPGRARAARPGTTTAPTSSAECASRSHSTRYCL